MNGDAAVVAQTHEITEGNRLLQEGAQLYAESTEPSLRRAIEVLQQASQWFHRAGIQEHEAIALARIGVTYHRLWAINQEHDDLLKQALVYADRALPLVSEENQDLRAKILHTIGAIYGDLN